MEGEFSFKVICVHEKWQCYTGPGEDASGHCSRHPDASEGHISCLLLTAQQEFREGFFCPRHFDPPLSFTGWLGPGLGKNKMKSLPVTNHNSLYQHPKDDLEGRVRCSLRRRQRGVPSPPRTLNSILSSQGLGREMGTEQKFTAGIGERGTSCVKLGIWDPQKQALP